MKYFMYHFTKKYSFAFVLIRPTRLVLKDHFSCILSVRTRLVSLISINRKEYFFGRHLCNRSICSSCHKLCLRWGKGALVRMPLTVCNPRQIKKTSFVVVVVLINDKTLKLSNLLSFSSMKFLYILHSGCWIKLNYRFWPDLIQFKFHEQYRQW